MSTKLDDEAKRKRTDPVYSDTYKQDFERYIKTVREKLLVTEGKCLDFEGINKKNTECCANPQKYKNGFNNMMFWSCKNCGADLGDIKD